ncbi:Cof-type HAD-IIB family hydrolase [Acinetobacter nosocomialis]|uniref:Cof-type HAD-IIB family hydrolase n=1 Tax=Acinetobacter nosocomialis TaxID=106654 RepID=UPI0003B28F84|nr:Cof-type HAD-IIB family hydrolase [Acinetobacter nosocomialis]MCE7533416.1 Cof-type HAD-IIB family hydrolase [Acinetobacter nosocomialis]MDH2636520.1 Cof-type HAD-IIB family hydrolase [Acinetobacter nosocomialis]OTT90336.1 hydrolase [Acinetobacter nosocomialis]QCP63537.1 HAD family hydrolase [Acinetobacter nosocomialis M2]
MTVKILAVDMDGTFLNSKKQYNKARFLKQYEQLKQNNIHFVVASGNQLAKLVTYFPEINHEIAFIAENGAHVVDAGQELAFAHLSKEQFGKILKAIDPAYTSTMVICGKQSAYVHRSMNAEDYAKVARYFEKLTVIDDFYTLDDLVCKITFTAQENESFAIFEHFQKQSFVADKVLVPVSSGFGFIDLILPDQHKAHGLKLLLQKWQIEANQVVAIGDNNNDIQMIKAAGYGFAVENAIEALKAVAPYTTLSNEREGALEVIDLVLQHQPPFA